MTIPETYPNAEIWSASFASFTCRGESGSRACSSAAIRPIIVSMPTRHTSITPSPSKTMLPRKRIALSTNVSPVISLGNTY